MRLRQVEQLSNASHRWQQSHKNKVIKTNKQKKVGDSEALKKIFECVSFFNSCKCYVQLNIFVQKGLENIYMTTKRFVGVNTKVCSFVLFLFEQRRVTKRQNNIRRNL